MAKIYNKSDDEKQAYLDELTRQYNATKKSDMATELNRLAHPPKVLVVGSWLFERLKDITNFFKIAFTRIVLGKEQTLRMMAQGEALYQQENAKKLQKIEFLEEQLGIEKDHYLTKDEIKKLREQEKAEAQQNKDPQQGKTTKKDPQQGNPQQGEPAKKDPQQGNSQQGEPIKKEPQQNNPQQGEPAKKDPQQNNPQQGEPAKKDPQNNQPQQNNPQQEQDFFKTLFKEDYEPGSKGGYYDVEVKLMSAILKSFSGAALNIEYPFPKQKDVTFIEGYNNKQSMLEQLIQDDDKKIGKDKDVSQMLGKYNEAGSTKSTFYANLTKSLEKYAHLNEKSLTYDLIKITDTLALRKIGNIAYIDTNGEIYPSRDLENAVGDNPNLKKEEDILLNNIKTIFTTELLKTKFKAFEHYKDPKIFKELKTGVEPSRKYVSDILKYAVKEMTNNKKSKKNITILGDTYQIRWESNKEKGDNYYIKKTSEPIKDNEPLSKETLCFTKERNKDIKEKTDTLELIIKNSSQVKAYDELRNEKNINMDKLNDFMEKKSAKCTEKTSNLISKLFEYEQTIPNRGPETDFMTKENFANYQKQVYEAINDLIENHKEKTSVLVANKVLEFSNEDGILNFSDFKHTITPKIEINKIDLQQFKDREYITLDRSPSEQETITNTAIAAIYQYMIEKAQEANQNPIFEVSDNQLYHFDDDCRAIFKSEYDNLFIPLKKTIEQFTDEINSQTQIDESEYTPTEIDTQTYDEQNQIPKEQGDDPICR